MNRTALVSLLLLSMFGSAQNSSSPRSSLADKTPKQLLRCLTKVTNTCGAEDPWEIAEALGNQRNKRFLLSEFWKTRNEERRLGIIYSLYYINSPDVATFFRRLVRRGFDDGEELYYPLNYLAKLCDPGALNILSGGGKGGYEGYPGCLQWSVTMTLFGKCKYREAIPFLIDSLSAACMNIGDAADESLHQLFPDAPHFNSAEKAQSYYRRKGAREMVQSQGTKDEIRLRATVQSIVPLSTFSGTITPVAVDPRFAMTVHI